MSALAKALLMVQQEAPKLQESGVNPHFHSKFVPLEKVMETVLPILNAHQLVLVQTPAHIDGTPALRTSITHTETGEEVSGLMPLAIDKPTPQAQGSALTYAKRYAVMSMLCLVGDKDDDGEAASAPARQSQAADSAPVSAHDKPVQKGTATQIGLNIKLLDKAFPEHPGDNRTWADEAKTYVKDRFEKDSVADLSEAQAVELNDWLENKFQEAQRDMSVPFEGSVA